MKNILYSIIFLISLLFYSCTQDVDVNVLPAQLPYAGYYQPGQTNGNGQFVIGGYVDGQYQSRVLASKSFLTRAVVSATYDDKFSLYAWTKDSTVMNGYHGIFSTTNNQATWGYTENVKYFDNFVDNYNFIGVIPQGNHTYNNGTVTVNAQSFTEDNATYDDREVLYASTTVAKANYSTGASLSFNHLNSKVFIKFTSDDANTEILDYSPYTPGTPGQAAYDEVIDVTEYSMTATTVPTLGPLVTAIDIDDADIDFINSKYTASKGFSSYQSSNTITGSLDENMWDYLLSKYPTLSSMNLGNWGTYASNTNMRLVHIDKTGHTSADNDSYKAVWVNVQSVNWSAGTTTQQVIHHDAIPEVPATGKPGIIMLPATSANQTGTDAVLATYPSDVNIELSLNDPVWTINSTSNTVTFTKPTGKVSTSQVASSTSWFTFPTSVANTSNLGYTIKFSYKYKGVTVYDARVFIPTNKCTWEAGKYYTYIINIKGRGNGHDTVVNPDGDDPRIEQIANYEITINQVNIINYIEGEEYEINVQ